MKHTSDAILQAAQASYLERLEAPRDPLLAKMEAFAAEKKHPISDPEVATFLAVTIAAMGAKRIIELGTNIGYGAIVMARAAGEGAHVTTIERSPEICSIARAYAKEAGLDRVIDVREGAAIGELEKLEGPFDFAYVDCVKEEYPRYLALLEPRIRKGGVLVADNVLWRGLVAQDDDKDMPETEHARVLAMREFNRALTSSAAFRAVVLPLGDGVGFAVRR